MARHLRFWLWSLVMVIAVSMLAFSMVETVRRSEANCRASNQTRLAVHQAFGDIVEAIGPGHNAEGIAIGERLRRTVHEFSAPTGRLAQRKC